MPRLAAPWVCAAMLATAGTAFAQSADLQLDAFHPAADARGYLTQNASETLDPGDVSFGLGALSWGRHLAAGPGYDVDNLVTATLVGVVGLRAGALPLEVGAALPLTIMTGTDPAGTLDGQGLGDLALHAKARLLHVGPLGLGALATVYLPTATPRDRFLGDPGVTPELDAIADLSLGRLRLAVNAGARLRSGMMSATELPLGVAAAWGVVPRKVELIAELTGALPIAPRGAPEDVEVLAGLKVYLAKSSYLALGIGRGLGTAPGEPELRGMIGIVFEPRSEPATHAAITDEDVAMATPPPPPTAADPFPDRDNDGIRDDLDKCPDDPENYNGYQDDDGCPDHDPEADDHHLVVVGKSRIDLLERIEFEFDKAVLRPSAPHILDAVARAMNDNPDIELVEVQGHTDEQGPDTYNLALSQRRAEAVVAYLVAHGVAAARLTAKGYGETTPLDPAHTQAAYAKNRRVEFHILKRDD